jgi:hypothetical protein
MFGLWRRLRRAYGRSENRLDELAVERAMLEHEEEERRKAEPTVPIPSMRNNVDWGDWGAGLG